MLASTQHALVDVLTRVHTRVGLHAYTNVSLIEPYDAGTICLYALQPQSKGLLLSSTEVSINPTF